MTVALRVRALRLGVVAALLTGPGLIALSPSSQAAYVPTAATVAAYEARVITLMNANRVNYGRVELVSASCPDAWAEWWAAYISRNRLFIHRDMTAFLNGCHATRVAENLGRGNISADQMMAMWMASPGHRANILDGLLTQVGVGAVYEYGQWTVVVDFARP